MWIFAVNVTARELLSQAPEALRIVTTSWVSVVPSSVIVIDEYLPDSSVMRVAVAFVDCCGPRVWGGRWWWCPTNSP
jgi:hypothetical protein